MTLSRENILTHDDLPREEVQIPEWGGSVLVRTMTGSERDAFESEHLKNPHKDLRARLAVATCCDEQGNLLFTAPDVESLAKKSAAALDRIFEVSARLSGLSKKDVIDLGNASGPTP